jgi:hypothetical protein
MTEVRINSVLSTGRLADIPSIENYSSTDVSQEVPFPANAIINVYPNPAKDNIVLKYNTKDPIQIDIYNVLGLRVKSAVHNTNESNIDISDLQNGVYFLRFKDDGRTISKSFTKAE